MQNGFVLSRVERRASAVEGDTIAVHTGTCRQCEASGGRLKLSESSI